MITAKIIVNTLFVFNLAFVIAGIIRGYCVPGSRRRYTFTTFQWAVMPLAFAYSAVVILGSGISGSKTGLIAGVINFLTVVWVFYDLYKDDDDNWFKRKRKQLKHYLRSVRLRQPQLAGSKV